ncbi:GTP cyclohydrolase 1 type 2 [Buchnera aphidicola (Thelaxes suberi)]|uniref:Nif3-like dinuclear metal center hexameric protein n=1 Tax=Buchnera aphidicola TaxID=9 RepID=UPI0034640EE6
MNNLLLENIINKKLNTHLFQDSIPNGLQVEGKSKIHKILCGVTACQKLLDIAVIDHYDAIIVHHGYFWDNENKTIRGIKRNRLKTILLNDINLYSWHLPLDAHKTLGNNARIAYELNIQICGNITTFVMWGNFCTPMYGNDLVKQITLKFNRIPLYLPSKTNQKIKKIAWCSGKGQSFIYQAVDYGIDAFITGEVSEETFHFAYENNIHFFSAGHHATECFGIQELGLWLQKNYNLNIKFINIFNPI